MEAFLDFNSDARAVAIHFCIRYKIFRGIFEFKYHWTSSRSQILNHAWISRTPRALNRLILRCIYGCRSLEKSRYTRHGFRLRRIDFSSPLIHHAGRTSFHFYPATFLRFLLYDLASSVLVDLRMIIDYGPSAGRFSGNRRRHTRQQKFQRTPPRFPKGPASIIQRPASTSNSTVFSGISNPLWLVLDLWFFPKCDTAGTAVEKKEDTVYEVTLHRSLAISLYLLPSFLYNWRKYEADLSDTIFLWKTMKNYSSFSR